jgi:hypothetical protein
MTNCMYNITYSTSFSALQFSILYVYCFVFLVRTIISLVNINHLHFAMEKWCVCGEGNILLYTS